ncbi:DUF4333 domain-containing protein [Nocardioides sp. TRM66260-LWL]|uniref:DUF4333 domain-containing protein n=1 Tax=Nocardioides sp. TRM66260-LWL TaxID=2874478 RepID=UPI001CC39AFE|nr:DUF4333 domain-containing protein [Nocardioides sp. TRM66260-LWL]MBZ5736382.1 DUF4333 domain-containing protein [Nocardioides sp. TRM66260-LWL]
MRLRVLAASLSVASLALLGACSAEVSVGSEKSMSKADLEKKLTENFEQNNPDTPLDSVSCPGDLKAEVGQAQTCTVVVNGESVDVKVTVTSVDGDNINFSIEEQSSDAPSESPSE